MKIFAEINESEVKKTLRKWSKMTGKGIEEGVDQMARATAPKLASKVQPWGMTDGPGADFIKSISAQVSRVWFGINLGYFKLDGSFERTYNSLRRRGSIPRRKFRKKVGHSFRFRVSEADRDALIRKQTAKAGRAKAAWVAAGVSVNGKRIRVTGRWISRHVSSGWGSSRKIGRGMDAEIELHNRTPYLKHVQSGRDVKAGLRLGRSAGLSSFRRAINYHIKKANR